MDRRGRDLRCGQFVTELAVQKQRSAEASTLRYPAAALAGYHLRGATGLCVSLGPLLFLEPAPAVTIVLAAFAAIFLVHCARGVIRQYSCVEYDEAGIRISGIVRHAIRWEMLQELRVRYYTTRRDGESGWMQLQLRGDREHIVVDSSLTSFTQLVAVCATRFSMTGRELDDISRTNLASRGVSIK